MATNKSTIPQESNKPRVGRGRSRKVNSDTTIPVKEMSESLHGSEMQPKVSNLNPGVTSKGHGRGRGRSKQMSVIPSASDTDQQLLQRRADRFSNDGTRSTVKNPQIDLTVSDAPFSGTCTDLRKSYFRLTKMPLASEVRPPEILEEALQYVVDLWTGAQRVPYLTVCDLFKSIRQDLMVQHIRNNLSIRVYESHALVAMEAGDHEEFNQCRSQLQNLYREGCSDCNISRFPEFIAYSILYAIFTEDSQEVMSILTSLDPEHRHDDYIEFALSVYKAWSQGNYHRLFSLTKANSVGSCDLVIAFFLGRERSAALRVMLKAYRPKLPLAFIAKELGFTDSFECIDFIRSLCSDDSFTNLNINQSDGQTTDIDCKDLINCINSSSKIINFKPKISI